MACVCQWREGGMFGEGVASWHDVLQTERAFKSYHAHAQIHSFCLPEPEYFCELLLELHRSLTHNFLYLYFRLLVLKIMIAWLPVWLWK